MRISFHSVMSSATRQWRSVSILISILSLFRFLIVNSLSHAMLIPKIGKTIYWTLVQYRSIRERKAVMVEWWKNWIRTIGISKRTLVFNKWGYSKAEMNAPDTRIGDSLRASNILRIRKICDTLPLLCPKGKRINTNAFTSDRSNPSIHRQKPRVSAMLFTAWPMRFGLSTAS